MGGEGGGGTRGEEVEVVGPGGVVGKVEELSCSRALAIPLACHGETKERTDRKSVV